MRALHLTPLLIALAGPAFGQDASLQRCRVIADTTARLACYDALADARPKPPAPPAAPVAAAAAMPVAVDSPTRPPPSRVIDVGAARSAGFNLKHADDLTIIEGIGPKTDELFRSHGIDPAQMKIVVVKSPAGFRAAYGPIAKDMMVVDTPGVSTANLNTLPWRRVQRPIYPLDTRTRLGKDF